MKKIFKRKRLNNKGFTLIELLAVVVILAVVMGIAANSVLSAMNKSRAGALQDTAQVIANAFNQKYTESLVDSKSNDVYADVLGGNGKGYDFSKTAIYYLSDKLAGTYNISTTNYKLSNIGNNKPTALTYTPSADAVSITSSVVMYNASTGKFIVCMVANPSGSNFIAGSALTADKTFNSLNSKVTDTTFQYVKVPTGTMLACSDGAKTW